MSSVRVWPETLHQEVTDRCSSFVDMDLLNSSEFCDFRRIRLTGAGFPSRCCFLKRIERTVATDHGAMVLHSPARPPSTGLPILARILRRAQ